jgi:hypothetical protein
VASSKARDRPADGCHLSSPLPPVPFRDQAGTGVADDQPGRGKEAPVAATFMQLACGRIDPQEQIDAGLVTRAGNAELGDRAARNLRYTM